MGLLADIRGAISADAVATAFRRAHPPRLGRKGPPIAAQVPMPAGYTQLLDYKAMGKSVDTFISTIRTADLGHTGPLMDIFYDARDYDSHLDGIARKRAQSMMGRPINIKPPDGYETDREAAEIAKRVRHVLLVESRRFRSMLQHLMSASVDSYAVAPLHWTVNRDGVYVPHLQYAHPNRFGFHKDTRELGFYTSGYRNGWDISPLSDYPDSFIAHVPVTGRSDYPWRRGPMRACIVPSFIKRHGISFWLVLAERFGMPQPYAIVPEGEDWDGESSDALIGQTKAALQSLGRYWSAVFTEGIQIESIPGSGAVNADLHKNLVDWAEMTQSIALLGQNLSTKVEGGSFAAAEAHRYVAADIHLADAVELAETITQQLIEPIVRYNWPGAPVPTIEFSTGQRQVFSMEDVLEGVATEDEYRRTKGHEPKSDGTGNVYRRPRTAPAAGDPTPGPEGQPVTDPLQMPDANEDLPLAAE